MGFKKVLNAFVEFLQGLFFGALVLAVFVFFALVLHFYVTKDKLLEGESETISSEEVILHADTTNLGIRKYYLSYQSWTDFNRNKHTLPFKVGFEDVLQSAKNRNSLKVAYKGDDIGFWSVFYNNLADHDRPLVEELARTFHDYQKKENMDRRDFAELMITAIQDIPYTLILQNSCSPADTEPCIGSVRMGLYAPAEFVAYLKGDCDTRTVLLFTLLSRFNYDVAIINSVKYRHSVLGLGINSTGKYKTHNRRKYYFVETTSKQNPIGYLHPKYSELNYWDVVLTN